MDIGLYTGISTWISRYPRSPSVLHTPSIHAWTGWITGFMQGWTMGVEFTVYRGDDVVTFSGGSTVWCAIGGWLTVEMSCFFAAWPNLRAN